MTRKRKTAHTVCVAPGDLVLLGQPGTSMPSDWYRGKVEWTSGEEIVVRQWGFGGSGSWLGVIPADHVRAIGDHTFLSDFQERCRTEIALQQSEVDAALAAISAARANVWKKLDEIGAAGVQRSGSGGEVDPA